MLWVTLAYPFPFAIQIRGGGSKQVFDFIMRFGRKSMKQSAPQRFMCNPGEEDAVRVRIRVTEGPGASVIGRRLVPNRETKKV